MVIGRKKQAPNLTHGLDEILDTDSSTSYEAASLSNK